MTLLAPWALWGLLALAVPVLLHLRRRRVGRTVQVGSVKHLESLPTAERRGMRLREPWLLLLRLAILGTLVTLLGRPFLDRHSTASGMVALVDSAAASALKDSLGATAKVLVERIDDPWRRVQELDDSLPPGVPLVIAASTSSEWFSGPRPVASRQVSWLPLTIARSREHPQASGTQASSGTREASRALAAAVAAVAEELGPLPDTSGWRSRLPSWWRDSLASMAFPVAVARALAPARALPPPVLLTALQVTPRLGPASTRHQDGLDLHWWLWGLAATLFLLERWIARPRQVGQ